MDMLDFLEAGFLPPGSVPLDAPWRPKPQRINGGMPNGPQRLPARLVRRIAQQQSNAPAYTPVREVERAADLLVIPFSIGVALLPGAQQILVSPDRDRIILIIRNAATSAGTVFVGFGSPAVDATATVSLAPGQAAIFDYTVPQNDVWVTTDLATTTGAVSYALAGV